MSIILALTSCRVAHLPHTGSSPVYPLVGAHAPLPCASCHGDADPPTAQPTSCLACHAADIPSSDHFPNEECGDCHTPYGWNDLSDADTDADTDSDTDSDTDADTDPPTGFDHTPYLPESSAHTCMSCHDGDRPDPSHNAGWDCGPCHQVGTSWSDSPFPHPIKTAHGGQIVACADCHPDAPDYGFGDCVTCHLDDKLATSHHGLPANPDPNDPQFPDACIDCHRYGTTFGTP